ncbi:hypothetical protein GYMLUDRAFT_245057 [Collybiopsis luxurians FD-317 M1]|uniref:Uncharacterized protein n=1 Tax=Collybiopsis luxurians FD-317 M1 TaxID=944289 RepID=A0A0D0CBJ0_9AGAR|nr:hypothetical protein GYMLUDRAFT_245057 [Collybiopsis luxurians FD-317 M1]
MKTTLDRWENHSSRYPLTPVQKAKLEQYKTQYAQVHTQLEAAYNRRVENGTSSLNTILAAVEKMDAKGVELQKLSTELSQKLAEAEALKAQRLNHVDSNVSIPSKRRRLSSGYEDASSTSPLLAQTKEINELHVTLKSIAERVSTVENNITAQETEVREVMLAYTHDRAQAKDAGELAANPLEARVNDIHEETNRIGEELSEVSEWVAEAINENAKDEDEFHSLLQKKDEQEEVIRSLLVRVEEHGNTRTKDKDEIKALSATLKAYCDKPVSPPSSPFDPKAVIDDMKDQITQLVHNAVKPHIEGARSALAEDLQKYDSELYSMLWSKLSLTNKVIAAVSEATKQPPAT